MSAPALGQVPPAAGGTVSGAIVDQDGGVPVSNAAVSLFHGDQRVAQTMTTGGGAYTFTNQPPGIYYVLIQALGYQTVRSDDFQVTAGSVTSLKSAMTRARTGASEPREIGRVSVNALGRNALSTSTTITQSVSTELLNREGYNRVGDALQTLPGVNLEGLSSSIGDSISVDIRGFNSSETQSLLDGHTFGPLGAGGFAYDYQDSPGFAIGNTLVTYGSGALGLYGTDSIGGTVDMQTINPTRQPHFQFTQGIGNQGKSVSDFQATGTVGRLGYALVHAVLGAYGPYVPQDRVQNGLLNGDFAPANVQANTYVTSQNYLLRNDLLKVTYDISRATKFSFTTLSANSWDDKTGNGDNCYFNYSLQLYRANQTASAPNTYTLPGASAPLPGGCPAGQVAATFDEVTTTCLTPQQYATRATGLAGGGPGPFQAHRFNDYHGRITTQLGNQTFTVDSFGNRYSTDYNRAVAGGSLHTDFYDTTGLLLSDDIASSNNDFGFGYYVQHQNHIGTFLWNQGGALQGQLVFGANSTLGQVFSLGNTNFFLRDQYTPAGNLSVFLNAWLKRSTVTHKTTFDPRVSFVFRPTNRDVVRLTGGRSDGEPAPDLLQGPPSLNLTPTNITPACGGGLTGVGSTSNPNLQPETSTDVELGYGHRFASDTIVQLDAYASFEKNRIFSGTVPISAIPQVTIPASLLSAYLARVNAFCGTTTATPADLAFSTNFNAASARFQGLELNGRYRFNPRLYLDYTYDIQSAVNLGVPDSILANNVTLINGSQILGLPLHKASAGLDYQDRRGFEARLDTYYISANNPYNRPEFFYSNVTLSKQVHTTTFNIGVQNLFDSAASSLFVFGAAPFVAENQFGTDKTHIQQLNTQLIGQTGLLPPLVTFSITERI